MICDGPAPGRWTGIAGLAAGWRELLSAWEQLRIEPTEYREVECPEIRDLGDRLVVIGHLRARGKESGAEVESPVAYVVEVKNGKAVRVTEHLDPKEALAAAGLKE